VADPVLPETGIVCIARHVLVCVPDLGLDVGGDEPVPLPDIKAQILKKVLEWCTYHRDDPPAAEEDNGYNEKVPDWDSKFLLDQYADGVFFEMMIVRFTC
jgi:S-phase kinase-associated protein 1